MLPLLFIPVVLYFFMIRPVRQRQREALELQSRLAPGQRVMTTSGLFATVTAVEDDAVVLETAPGAAPMRWAKAAVARIEGEADASGDPSARTDGEGGTAPG
ncbi:MAG: preprotein translocase subunit YajC [Actinomycetota bacterium]|nr:preprotein translocase subunit YajC [Actinomycetota bacterium]